nr:ribonuclease H [Tanacetum cinerariifolium]
MVSKAVDNSLISDRDECQNLVNILARYCSASGQNINFTKSFALFSPDSPEDLQQQLCNLLNVQRMDPKARYLGFPSVIGRNKNELFSFILDKVLHKMQGWKQKLLSQVDREILIISVIQAIPSYVMQCYLLPKGISPFLVVAKSPPRSRCPPSRVKVKGNERTNICVFLRFCREDDEDEDGVNSELALFTEALRPDCAGRIGISALVKYTFVIRQMAYDIVPDALDEYLQMGATTACDNLVHFWKVQDVPFVANDVTYKRGYYLIDEIYPEWFVLIKFISNMGSNDHKRIMYKTVHETTWKDVERAFGVLKRKLKIIK